MLTRFTAVEKSTTLVDFSTNNVDPATNEIAANYGAVECNQSNIREHLKWN